MYKQYKKSLLSLSAITAMALTGCGSNGGNGTPTVTGIFADAAIGNASYKCGGTTGFTNTKGEFTCPVGSSVTFYYGNIELGSISKLPSDNIVMIQDALNVDRDKVSNSTVSKLAVFLQSLDNDGDDTDGIYLDPKLIENLVKTKQKFTDIKDTQVTHIIDTAVNADKNRKMRRVTPEQAQENLRVVTNNVKEYKSIKKRPTTTPKSTSTPTTTSTPASTPKSTITPRPKPTCGYTLNGVYFNGAVISAENNITFALDKNITLVFNNTIETAGLSITPAGSATANKITKTADKNITFVYNAPMSMNNDQAHDHNQTSTLTIKQGACTFTPEVNLFSHPLTLVELKTLITNYTDPESGPVAKKNNATLLSNANTAAITDMHSLFETKDKFNLDIGDWNTSSVTNMSYMFHSATSFDQNISDWNVSSVTNMSDMFNGASTFDQNLSTWDVNSVGTNHTDFNKSSGITDPSKLPEFRMEG